jgi:hypothetical protein
VVVLRLRSSWWGDMHDNSIHLHACMACCHWASKQQYQHVCFARTDLCVCVLCLVPAPALPCEWNCANKLLFLFVIWSWHDESPQQSWSFFFFWLLIEGTPSSIVASVRQ